MNKFRIKVLSQKGYEIEGFLGDGRYCEAYLVKNRNGLATAKTTIPKLTERIEPEMDSDYIPMREKVGHLKKEYYVLEIAQDIPGIPSPIDLIEVSLPKHLKILELSKRWELRESKILILIKEYVEGHFLNYRINEKIEGKENIDFAFNIVESLHSRGIVGLDLHPKNIIIDTTCRPNIIDLGMSHIVGLDIPEDEKYVARYKDNDFKRLETLVAA